MTKPRRKALSLKNAPRRLPLWQIAVWGLLLDRFDAPGWLWGAVGLLAVLVLIYAILDFFAAEDIEIGGAK